MRSAGSKPRYGYQGSFAEDETEQRGTVAFMLRDYDPVIGRWLSVDPERVGFSPYIGMGNNPIGLTDPTGGRPVDDWVFDTNGNFVRVDRNDQPHRIVIEDQGSIVSSWLLHDQDWDQYQLNTMYDQGLLQTAQFAFNVTYLDMQAIMGGFEEMGTLQRYWYAWTESTGGDLDLAYQGLGARYLDNHPIWGSGYMRELWSRDNSDPGIFFLVHGTGRAFNFKDGGNFLWGNGMHRIGFDYQTTRWGSLRNNPNDSQTDQNAIMRGWAYPIR